MLISPPQLIAFMGYKWIVVGVLFVVAFLNEVDRHAIYALFPLLEKDLGMSKLQLGMLGSAFLWAYAVLGPHAGYIGDRFPRRKVIMFSLGAWSTMTALNGFVTSGNQLIVLRACLAIAEAFYMPTALAFIAEHHDESTRSKAIAIHLSAMAVGQISGGFLGGYMADHFSWRTLFLGLGAAGVLYVPVVGLLLHAPATGSESGRTLQTSPTSFGRSAAILASIPTIRFFALAFVCYSIAGAVMQTWLPYFLFHRFHTTLTMAGFSAAFYLQLPTALGNVAWGGVSDYFATRSDRARMAIQSFSLAVSGLLFFPLGMSGTLTAVALSLGLLGFLRTGWPPNVMPVIFQVAPETLRSTTYGFLNCLGNVAAGLSALVAGTVGGKFGFSGAFVACSFVHWLAAGALAYAVFHHLKRDFIRKSPAPAAPVAAQERSS
jgi:MFS family permease